jgi:hypothetical protein
LSRRARASAGVRRGNPAGLRPGDNVGRVGERAGDMHMLNMTVLYGMYRHPTTTTTSSPTKRLRGSAAARGTYAYTVVAFGICNTAVTAPGVHPFTALMVCLHRSDVRHADEAATTDGRSDNACKGQATLWGELEQPTCMQYGPR